MKVQLFAVILEIILENMAINAAFGIHFCSIEIGCIKFVRKKASLHVLFSVL